MSATASGPASTEFDRLMARFAAGLRLVGAVAGSAGALLGLAAPAEPAAVGIAVAVQLGWAACYATRTLRDGWTRWLVAVDIAIAVALCLSYRWLVPGTVLPGWSTWLTVVASSAVVVSQVSRWPGLGFAGTVAVPVAYEAGSLLAGRPVSGLPGLLAVQGLGVGLLMWTLRRHARATDAAIARQEALHRDAAVRAGRRAEEREHCRLLHDSVSATLTVVAAGGVTGSATLRTQAWRDLAVVEQIQIPAGDAAMAGAPGRTGRPGPADEPGPAGLAETGLAETGLADAGLGEDGPAGLDSAARAGVRGDDPPPGRADLRGWLAPVVSAQPALAVEMTIAPVRVPAAVGTALAGAVAEALRNVARHAGADRVSLRAWPTGGGVRVELADDGRGFDPALVPAQRRGLRESVVARLARVGGSAAITSQPGAGTRIVLDAPTDPPGPSTAGPDAPQAPPAQPAGGEPAGPDGVGDLVATRYQRAFELVVLTTLTIRHLAHALVPIISHRSAYRSFGAELVAWALMAAVGVVAARRMLRRQTGAVTSWLLAGTALAASAVATAAVGTGQEFTVAHWAISATGWFGVLVLLRRPIAELVALIVLNAGLTLAVLVRDGAADRDGLARFLMVAFIWSALQLGLALVIRALDGTARRAAAAAERQAAVHRRVEVAEALHRSRLDRYQTVCRSVVPLLLGLASGELDPAERRTQRRCAVEGSRLRRLFAETDDVPDPLLHELRACADIAYSRGVLVDLQVIGQLPELTRSVRRALTEAPLHALAGAQREARVTVFGRSDEVAISVLADALAGEPAEPPLQLDRARSVTMRESVVAGTGEQRRWIEARWRAAPDRQPASQQGAEQQDAGQQPAVAGSRPGGG
ncbi:MAG TPA: ATP-binding protein [Mycobacteriales bacterium]|nr:ATP-binding protein [Mycobacteriales bacterium]